MRLIGKPYGYLEYIMVIQNIKFRHITLALQLLAGFSLLTLSYVNTEENWADEFLDAAIYKSFPSENGALENMKAGINC